MIENIREARWQISTLPDSNEDMQTQSRNVVMRNAETLKNVRQEFRLDHHLTSTTLVNVAADSSSNLTKKIQNWLREFRQWWRHNSLEIARVTLSTFLSSTFVLFSA